MTVQITNGSEELVMREAGGDQELLAELDHVEAMAGVRRGLEAIKDKRSRPIHEFLAELRQEFGFPETRPKTL